MHHVSFSRRFEYPLGLAFILFLFLFPFRDLFALPSDPPGPPIPQYQGYPLPPTSLRRHLLDLENRLRSSHTGTTSASWAPAKLYGALLDGLPSHLPSTDPGTISRALIAHSAAACRPYTVASRLLDYIHINQLPGHWSLRGN